MSWYCCCCSNGCNCSGNRNDSNSDNRSRYDNQQKQHQRQVQVQLQQQQQKQLPQLREELLPQQQRGHRLREEPLPQEQEMQVKEEQAKPPRTEAGSSIPDTAKLESSTQPQQVKPAASFWDPSEEVKEVEELHLGASSVSNEIFDRGGQIEVDSILCFSPLLEMKQEEVWKKKEIDQMPHSLNNNDVDATLHPDHQHQRTTSHQPSDTDDPRIPVPQLDTSDPLGLLMATEEMIGLFFK
ncbi:putative mediator of RNA polymerase II transcription subunit 21 [Osmia bicornis bicornis]|uniref:putative mediator of RNA polymerase II transcription subunit 21 n=1 Tax=Osmia bicornis bicornis TaxID=1437191 RepID=UPI001EAF1984|nr:putative mediator of RNA polymerase II transcription subunit 21 [Osmia bicornis bicornis]